MRTDENINNRFLNGQISPTLNDKTNINKINTIQNIVNDDNKNIGSREAILAEFNDGIAVHFAYHPVYIESPKPLTDVKSEALKELIDLDVVDTPIVANPPIVTKQQNPQNPQSSSVNAGNSVLAPHNPQTAMLAAMFTYIDIEFERVIKLNEINLQELKVNENVQSMSMDLAKTVDDYINKAREEFKDAWQKIAKITSSTAFGLGLFMSAVMLIKAGFTLVAGIGSGNPLLIGLGVFELTQASDTITKTEAAAEIMGDPSKFFDSKNNAKNRMDNGVFGAIWSGNPDGAQKASAIYNLATSALMEGPGIMSSGSAMLREGKGVLPWLIKTSTTMGKLGCSGAAIGVDQENKAQPWLQAASNGVLGVILHAIFTAVPDEDGTPPWWKQVSEMGGGMIGGMGETYKIGKYMNKHFDKELTEGMKNLNKVSNTIALNGIASQTVGSPTKVGSAFIEKERATMTGSVQLLEINQDSIKFLFDTAIKKWQEISKQDTKSTNDIAQTQAAAIMQLNNKIFS